MVAMHSGVDQGSEIRQTSEPVSTPVLDVLLLLSRSNRRLAATTALALIVGACIAFSISPTYTAEAVIMPPQSPQSSLSSLMGQLGALSTIGGAGNLLKSPADLYVGILQSRSIADRAIDTFRLQALWHTRTMNATRKRLSAHVQFEASKDGLITIQAKDHDPRRASDLANFFVDALYHVNSTLAISEAAQRRLFFEQQLQEEKGALAAAEEDLKAFQQKSGLLSLTGQAELAVRSIAQTRAQIAAKQVELQGLNTYAAQDNPDVIRVQQELNTLRSQMAELENSQKQLAPGDTQIAATQVPEGSLEYARRLREVKYHDTLLDLLSRQYEAARIDEAKSAPIIQVVDRALPPDQKSGPPRLLIILGMGVFGFIVAAAYTVLLGSLQQARSSYLIAVKLSQLRDQWRWHKS